MCVTLSGAVRLSVEPVIELRECLVLAMPAPNDCEHCMNSLLCCRLMFSVCSLPVPSLSLTSGFGGWTCCS